MENWQVVTRIGLVALFCQGATGQLSNSPAGASGQRSDAVSNGVDSAPGQRPQLLSVTNSTDVDWNLRLGISYYEKGEYQTAVTFLEEAVHLGPSNYQANLYLGYNRYYLEQFAGAASALRAASECRPTDAKSLYWLGESLYRLKRYGDAIPAFQRVLRLESNHAEAWYGLGCCEYYRLDYERAAEAFGQSARWEPTNCDASLYLGYSRYHLKQFEAAASALRLAAECRPTDAEALYFLGQSLYGSRRYSDAIPVFRKVLRSETNNAWAWFGLGCCEYYRREYQRAAASFRRSALQEPTNYLAHMWLGYSLVRAGRSDRAASAFQEAEKLYPGDFDANYWRGISLVRFGRFLEAIPSLELALHAKPRDKSSGVFLLVCYLATGQIKKIASLHFGIFLAILVCLIVSYVPVTVLLLRKSLRLGPRPEPGIGFTAAWWSVTMLGQSVLILLAFMISWWSTSQAFGVGVLVSALPLIIAAQVGFARQPWGMAFGWPPRVPERRALLSILGAVLGAVAFGAVYTAFVVHIRGKPMPQQLVVDWIGSDARNWRWSILLAVGIATPVAEEILFRGLLYGAIRKRLSGAWTVVVTAAAFTLPHVQPIFFPPIFGVGLALGWARHKSGSIWPPAIIHCLNNCTGLLIVMLSARS